MCRSAVCVVIALFSVSCGDALWFKNAEERSSTDLTVCSGWPNAISNLITFMNTYHAAYLPNLSRFFGIDITDIDEVIRVGCELDEVSTLAELDRIFDWFPLVRDSRISPYYDGIINSLHEMGGADGLRIKHEILREIHTSADAYNITQDNRFNFDVLTVSRRFGEDMLREMLSDLMSRYGNTFLTYLSPGKNDIRVSDASALAHSIMYESTLEKMKGITGLSAESWITLREQLRLGFYRTAEMDGMDDTFYIVCLAIETSGLDRL